MQLSLSRSDALYINEFGCGAGRPSSDQGIGSKDALQPTSWTRDSAQSSKQKEKTEKEENFISTQRPEWEADR